MVTAETKKSASLIHSLPLGAKKSVRVPMVFVPFQWGNLVRMMRYLNPDVQSAWPVIRMISLRLSHLAIVQAGWLLDCLTAPKWRQTQISGPVFIIGHQRSGTTHLHRMLAADRYAGAMTLGEMLVPSVSFQRLLKQCAGFDRLLGAPLKRAIRRWQDNTLGRLDHLHRIRLDEVEEDEFLLWSICASGMCAHDTPLAAGRKELHFMRKFESWSTAKQYKALGWYQACILKKAYRERSSGCSWIVAKNPAFSQKIPYLVQVFPGAKFINLIRNPMEAIPSRLNLIDNIWRLRYPQAGGMTPKRAAGIVDDSVRTYLFAQQDLEQLPPNHAITVLYRDLVKDSRSVVRAIYSRLRLPGPGKWLNQYLCRLPAHTARGGINVPAVLDRYGISEKTLRGRLAPIMDKYEFS